MENFLEFARGRAVVGVARHKIFHVRPPSLANRSLGYRFPALLILDFCISESLTRFGMEDDRVALYAVLSEYRFQLGPDGRMPLLIGFFFPGMHRHHESLAYHR